MPRHLPFSAPELQRSGARYTWVRQAKSSKGLLLSRNPMRLKSGRRWLEQGCLCLRFNVKYRTRAHRALFRTEDLSHVIHFRRSFSGVKDDNGAEIQPANKIAGELTIGS